MPRLLRLALCAVALSLTLAPIAAAAVPDGMGDQAAEDGLTPFSGGSTWANLANGPAVRPYLKSLAVVNGGASQTVYTGGPGGLGSTTAGDVTAVISPTNLCAAGQTGGCYATPNRVGISFGYVQSAGSVGRNFANPHVPLNQTVDANTIFDVVIGLNSLGRTVRWSWGNGNLVNWKITGLGTDTGEIHLRVSPRPTPEIDYSQVPSNGCTATPIRDCDIDRASDEFLESQLLLSLDGTLPDALSGAVFFTQRAILGFLQPSGTGASPSLDLQMASSHLEADGSAQRGTLQAVLPAAGLQSLYDLTPGAAAGSMSATRVGDPGSSGTPDFTAVAASDLDSAGLRVEIGNISFSAPTYRLAKRGSGGGPALRSVRRSGRRIVVSLGGIKKRARVKGTVLAGKKVIGTARGTATAKGRLKLSYTLSKSGLSRLRKADAVSVRLTVSGSKRRITLPLSD